MLLVIPIINYIDVSLHLFQIWILEASMQSCRWWTKEPNVLPRGIAWTQKYPFVASELFGELFPEVITIIKYLATLHITSINTCKSWYDKLVLK